MTSVVRETSPPEVSAMTTSTLRSTWPLAETPWMVIGVVPGAVPAGAFTSSSSAGDWSVPVVVTLPTMSPPPLSVVV